MNLFNWLPDYADYVSTSLNLADHPHLFPWRIKGSFPTIDLTSFLGLMTCTLPVFLKVCYNNKKL